MLVEFTVSNFKSIKEPQTLSMVATNAKEHPDNVFQPSPNENIKLLKTAVIYGANASGKSNLFEAIGYFHSLVRTSTRYNPGDKIAEYKPYKLDTNNLESPVSFAVEFFGWDKIRYYYEFSFTDKEIIYEALHFYPKRQKTKLFVRHKGLAIDFGDSLKGNKKIVESQLLPNQLFVSKAASNNNDQIVKMFIMLINIDSITSNVPKLISITMNALLNDSVALKNPNKLIDSLASLLERADTGIDGIDIEKVSGNENKFVPRTFHKISNASSKAKNKIAFYLDEESEGTQKLFGVGGFVLQLLRSGIKYTSFFDELNNSFHPFLTEMLIKLFNNAETNPYNCQLIFTTHDTALLSHNLFRRDQIWFTEKNQYGATSLYSLAEFDLSKVRANIPFDKWYLNGMFGALPIIQQFNSFPDAKPPKKTKRKAVS